MSFNNFDIYSVQSSNNGKLKQDVSDVLNLVQEFDTIKDINSAREYLKEVWDIEQEVINLPLGDCCTLTTKNTDKGFKISFLSQQDNITYYYKK